MLDRRRRAGPLAVDSLPALVDEYCGVAGSGMEFGDGVRDEEEAGVVPRAGTDPVACVRHLITACRIPLDAEIRPPGPTALTNSGGQSLTRGIRTGEAAKIASDARGTGYEEAHRRTGRRGWRLVIVTRSCCEDRDQK